MKNTTNQTETDIKQLVKEKYSEIAGQASSQNKASCCGSGSCSSEVYNIMSDDYSKLSGYQPDADLGLGCGLPTEFAKIKEGDTVVDLGSGAGNDCFVARAVTGEKGKVIGIDFSETMIEKARKNTETLRYNNIEFRLGDIEKLPLSANTADVVISNCVLNLVPDKEKAFAGIYRVLKPTGHFSISDVVITGVLPPAIKKASEMYVGCVAGAINKDEYLKAIEKAGFINVIIQKEKEIIIPQDILSDYLSNAEIEEYKKSQVRISSITVYGEKSTACCGPECCN